MKKLVFLLLASLCIGLSIFSVQVRDHSIDDDTAKEKDTIQEVETKPKDDIVDISFVAVGDNIIHSTIYKYNQYSDGHYDFRNIYKNTNQYTQKADVSYINFETICAGEKLGLSNYPAFNGPVEVIDAVHDAGFDWLSASSNHSFDRGEAGILTQLEYTRQNYPKMLMTGLHDSLEDANQSVVLEKKGVKIGLLSYTYGLNTFNAGADKNYLVDRIDKDKIKSDMEKLKRVSDLQFVSMHWGQEYQFTPNDEQVDLAQYLSDLGVDVIIGTHPHVIQPMDYITGKDGNQTLVMYSLGNFLSAQDEAKMMLGGMAKWHIRYNRADDTFHFDQVQFLPTVTQIGPHFASYETYALKDWSNQLGENHVLSQRGYDISREYFINLTHQVMNDKIEIIY